MKNSEGRVDHAIVRGAYDLPVSWREYVPYQALRLLFSGGPHDTRTFLRTLYSRLTAQEVFEIFLARGIPHVVTAITPEDMWSTQRTSPLYQYQEVSDICFKLQVEALIEINAALNSAGIAAALVKGSHLVNALTPLARKGFSADLDILVVRDRVEHIKRTLKNLGYSQEFGITYEGRKIVRRDPDDIAQYERKGFALAPFVRIVRVPELRGYEDLLSRYNLAFRQALPFEGSWAFGVKIDVHQTLDTYVLDEDIWAASEEISVGGTPITIPSMATLGWFLASRYYSDVIFHGAKTMKPLADLASICSGGRMNYAEVMRLCRKYNGFFGAVYYVYRALAGIGIAVPDELLTMPAPVWHRTNQGIDERFPPADLGDFLPRLFGRRPSFALELDNREASFE